MTPKKESLAGLGSQLRRKLKACPVRRTKAAASPSQISWGVQAPPDGSEGEERGESRVRRTPLGVRSWKKKKGGKKELPRNASVRGPSDQACCCTLFRRKGKEGRTEGWLIILQTSSGDNDCKEHLLIAACTERGRRKREKKREGGGSKIRRPASATELLPTACMVHRKGQITCRTTCNVAVEVNISALISNSSEKEEKDSRDPFLPFR